MKAAVFRYTGIINFFERNGIDEFNMLSSVDDDCVFPPHPHGGTMKKVSCLTVEDLLKKYQAPNHIDYMSINTEGCELLIIKDFPFDEYSVSAITFEHSAAENGDDQVQNIKKILLERNYFEINKLGRDYMFINKDLYDFIYLVYSNNIKYI